MTRVLIDGSALSDGSQLRGVGTHLKRIIAGLSEQPELSVRVMCEREVALPQRVESIALRRRLPARLHALEHELRLPSELRRHPSDVFYSPAEHPPRRSSTPWIQTLHDLIPLTRPHPMLARDRRHWLRVGGRIRHAAAVVTPSRFSADEGIRHLALDPRLVHVVPHGVDPDRFRPGRTADEADPYVLHVAAWGPHKGFGEAVDVIAHLADRGLPHRLVLAGPQDGWMLAQIQAVVASSRRPERVQIAGYVEDLPALYSGASALLMSSRCEGFGLPALEAMACGTPVVAFSNSSLPEVVGDAGLLVTDGDVLAMAEAAISLIDDPFRRAEFSHRAVERASRFRWPDAVESYLQLMLEVTA